MSSPGSNELEEMGLHLSESSSSFDEEEYSEEEEELFVEGDEAVGVLPYQFEPIVEVENVPNRGDAHPPMEVPREDRLNDRDRTWCLCRECPSMPTEEECVCCREIAEVAVRQAEAEVNCITHHEGFGPVCTNIHVLRVAYFQYKQQFGERPGHGINEQYRYTAYRQFVRWCWGFLGRHVRVVLPACAVHQVRRSFPAEEFAGFRYPDLN